MNNPFKLMQNAQKIQDSMKNLQKDFAAIRVTGEAGAGMIVVSANGLGDILNINISDEAYKEGKQFVAELIVAATNDAKYKAQDAKKDKMQSMISELGLPAGVMDMPFFN